jgi:hypothetical protein
LYKITEDVVNIMVISIRGRKYSRTNWIENAVFVKPSIIALCSNLALEFHLYIFCIETIQNYTPPIKKFPE